MSNPLAMVSGPGPSPRASSHSGLHTHIIRDYKRFNTPVNASLTFLLYVCVTHTHEQNPKGWVMGFGSTMYIPFFFFPGSWVFCGHFMNELEPVQLHNSHTPIKFCSFG